MERLVILNLTHPKGYAAVVSNPTEAQKANTQYARSFAQSKPDGKPAPESILRIGYRMGPEVGKHYRQALGRSSYDAMVNYYRANYGRKRNGNVPNIVMPVLQFHGLKGTWDWVDEDYTLVTVPSSGHFVQWDAAELVSQTMKSWLNARD